jgi:dTDP-4-dehydrorhamnose reductase
MAEHVVILGASGMLGAMTVDVLAASRNLSVVATVRDPRYRARFEALYPEVTWRLLGAESDGDESITSVVAGATWVINCAGVIKPHIHDDNPAEIERALRVNALFPLRLARVARRASARVLQIATDCVYAGTRGAYTERAVHDAEDVYGKTKSLGEPFGQGVHSLRCSVVGPEPRSFASLLEWFLGQPRDGQVSGFTNHLWNGVTTLHFARVCEAVIVSGQSLPRMHHLIPSGTVSKCEMLRHFAEVYGRPDLRITPVAAPTAIARTLATDDPALNARLWQAAGYPTPPTVPQMIEEMGRNTYRWQKARS